MYSWMAEVLKANKTALDIGCIAPHLRLSKQAKTTFDIINHYPLTCFIFDLKGKFG